MFDELTADMKGIYLVTTQGSKHIWNLDEMKYMRMPGEASKSIGFSDSFNHAWQEITSVEAWPVVGKCFFTRVASSTNWHRSSTIVSIERIE